MIRTALYARYSDEAQNDSSIEQQVRLLRDRAAAEGWTIVAEFEDRAFSGSNAFRPGFQAMRDAAMAGKFDLLLSESVDRLSRDMEDMAGLYKRLRYRGVSIYTLLEGEVNDMTVAFKGGMASMFLKDLGRRVHRGLEQRVMGGESAGGWAYGYDIHRQWDAKGKRVGGSRVINEEQAAIVRRIFREYASGVSPRKIAHALNAEGIRTQNGGLWRDSTIYGNRRRGTGILNNELYIGKLIWGRQSFSKDPDTGRANGRINDESKWIRADVTHLRIIEDELWNRVKSMQRELDEKSPTSAGKQRPKRLFSFLLTCGCCGGGFAMVGRTQAGCSNARLKGPAVCTNRLCISEMRLEEIVFGALQEHILDPRLVAVFHRTYMEHVERVRASNNDAAEQNRAELDRTERALGKIADAIISGIDPALMKSKSDDLLRRKGELLGALQQRKDAPIFVHPDMAKRYRAAVSEIVSAFRLPEHHEQSAQRIRGLIEKVVLTPSSDGSELLIDLHGDIDNIVRLAAPPRKRGGVEISRIEEQSELGQIRWLAGRRRHEAPRNPASHHRLPDLAPVQGVMAGAKALQHDLRDDTQPQVVLAGAAGFEPANAGTKNRCLTTWRRPSRRAAYSRARAFGNPSCAPARGTPLAVGAAAVDPVEIVLAQPQGQVPDLEPPRARLGDRSDLGGASGQEHLLEALELLRPDRPLGDRDPALSGELDHRPAGDAVEEAVGSRRVKRPVPDEEYIGPGRLRHLAAPVEHQGVVIALRLRLMPRQGADHVEAGRLGLGRRRIGRGPAPRRDVEPKPLADRLLAEIGRPGPDRDGEVDLRFLRRDAHLLGAAPGERAHIGVLEPARGEHVAAGGVDLLDAVGYFEAEQLARLPQPPAVVGESEYLAAISALPLEHGRGVMERVGEDVDVRLPPWDEPAVEPDRAVAVIEAARVRQVRLLLSCGGGIGRAPGAVNRAAPRVRDRLVRPAPRRLGQFGAALARGLHRAPDEAGEAVGGVEHRQPGLRRPARARDPPGELLRSLRRRGNQRSRALRHPSCEAGGLIGREAEPGGGAGERVDEAEEEGRRRRGEGAGDVEKAFVVDPFDMTERPHQPLDDGAVVRIGGVAVKLGHALPKRYRGVRHRLDDRSSRGEISMERGKLDPRQDRHQDRRRVDQPRKPGGDLAELLRLDSEKYQRRHLVLGKAGEDPHALPSRSAARTDDGDPRGIGPGGEPALEHRSGHVAGADQKERAGQREGVGHSLPLEGRRRRCNRGGGGAALAQASPWVSIKAAAMASCGVLPAHRTNWKTG